MRNLLFRTLLPGLAVLALVALTNIAQAQNPLTLVEYTNVWKYFTNGTDLGTAWRAKTYNDAAWPAGRGLLGLETSPAQYTRAPFNTMFVPYDPSIITYYFRTHFNFTNYACELAPAVTLVASNYIDDGAVIYLNGTEMARFRVPAGQTFNAIASGGPATEGQDDVAVFAPPPGVLVNGDNVVAVEVHQQSGTSGDIVWGMNLTARLALPLMLPPVTNIITEIGQPTTFSVDVRCIGGQLQWYFGALATASPIPGATNATYTIFNTQPSHAGTYFVVASNCFGVVTSPPISLVVVDSPPKLVTATVLDTVQANVIEVIFSEIVTRSTAINPLNYRIDRADSCGPSVPVSTATHIGNVVRLTMGGPNWVPGADYLLTGR